MKEQNSFATLFRTFRLKSGISTLTEFADKLAEQEGIVYENSLYTKWQQGKRIPHDRKTILKLIHFFHTHNAITTIDEANQLLTSTGLSPLTTDEMGDVEFVNKSQIAQTVPPIIDKKQTYAPWSMTTSQVLELVFCSPLGSLMSGFYVALSLWWLSLTLFHVQSSQFNIAYAFVFGIIPLMGGLLVVPRAMRFDPTNNMAARAALFLGVGQLMWGTGQLVWSIYNFYLHIEVPFPSLSDSFFILSWPMWGIGIYYLMYVMGYRFSISSIKARPHGFFLSVLFMGATYYLLLVTAPAKALGGDLTILANMLNIIYPT